MAKKRIARGYSLPQDENENESKDFVRKDRGYQSNLEKNPHENDRADIRLNHKTAVTFGIRAYERGWLKDKKNYLLC